MNFYWPRNQFDSTIETKQLHKFNRQKETVSWWYFSKGLSLGWVVGNCKRDMEISSNYEKCVDETQLRDNLITKLQRDAIAPLELLELVEHFLSHPEFDDVPRLELQLRVIRKKLRQNYTLRDISVL